MYIQLASLGAGVIQSASGAVVPNVTGVIYISGTQTPVTIYSDASGDSPNPTGQFVTDSLGRIPGWIDPSISGEIDISIPGTELITAVLPDPYGTAQTLTNSAEQIAASQFQTIQNTLEAVTPPVGSGGSSAASLDYVNAAIAAALGGATVPVATGLPVLTGSPLVGATLSCTSGVWTGSPTSFTYQYQNSQSALGPFANITGATSSTYTSATGDSGTYLRCAVTAAGTTTAAYSNAIGPIAASLTLSNAKATVSGTTVVITVQCSSDIVNASLWTTTAESTKAAPDAIPDSNGVATWSVGNLAAGTITWYIQGYTSPAGYTGGSQTPQLAITFTIASSGGTGGGGGGGTTGGITLNASPTGPTAPSQGWTVAFGDTFSTGTLDNNFWVANRSTLANASTNQHGDNWGSNTPPPYDNNCYHNSSQTYLDSTGCNLVCEYKPSGTTNPQGVAVDYLCGYIQSRPASITAGYPATGFAWRADRTTMWAFEIVCTLPPVTTIGTGADWNFWATDDPAWTIEIDFFEIWGWNPKGNSMTSITWIYYTPKPQQLTQNIYYGSSGFPAFVTDGQQHRLTWLFNPSTQHVQPYQDGVALGTGISYPSSFTNGYMSLIAEAATRYDTSVTATRTMNIRSIAAYYRTGDSPSYLGGGLAAGTLVA